MKKALIVVDYQVDFVTGSLGNQLALNIEDTIAEKISKYHESGDDVIFTLDTHTQKYLQTQEGRNLPIIHCIKGEPGHELYGKVKEAKRPEDRCFEKPTFPCVSLFEFLKGTNYSKVEICGVTTSTCVLSNVVMVKAALPEAEIIIDARATASTTEINRDAALDIMPSLQVTVINR